MRKKKFNFKEKVSSVCMSTDSLDQVYLVMTTIKLNPMVFSNLDLFAYYGKYISFHNMVAFKHFSWC